MSCGCQNIERVHKYDVDKVGTELWLERIKFMRSEEGRPGSKRIQTDPPHSLDYVLILRRVEHLTEIERHLFIKGLVTKVRCYYEQN